MGHLQLEVSWEAETLWSFSVSWACRTRRLLHPAESAWLLQSDPVAAEIQLWLCQEGLWDLLHICCTCWLWLVG